MLFCYYVNESNESNKSNESVNLGVSMYKAIISESELGWGTRLIQERTFPTKEERDKFVKEFNDENMGEDYVPNSYFYAECAN